MKKKNGFMMYELVISFALAFAILLVIFNTSISLSKKLSKLYIKNKISTKQIILNKELGTKFNSTKVSTVETITNGCKITYDGGDTVSVIYSDNDKYIQVGDEKITFDEEVDILISDIKCEKDPEKSHIKIPIKYVDDNIDYGIDLYNFIN